MKTRLLLIILIACSITSHAQLTGEGVILTRAPLWPYIIFNENGTQVARIQGTGGMFAVTSTTGGTNWLTVNSSSGNVGIGTSSPISKLDMRGGYFNVVGYNVLDYTFVGRSADTNDSYFYHRISANYHLLGSGKNGTGLQRSLGFSLGGSDSEADIKMMISPAGNVGIGSLNPNQKLTVNGTIYGKEVKVDLSVPGPDYVFLNTYSLRSLAEVEDYIKTNQHLPEVPSAAQMEKEGINVSEMNMLLLKKVEELTLYVIQLRKDLDAVKNKKNKN